MRKIGSLLAVLLLVILVGSHSALVHADPSCGCPSGTSSLSKYERKDKAWKFEQGTDAIDVTGNAITGTWAVKAGYVYKIVALTTKAGQNCHHTAYVPAATSGTYTNEVVAGKEISFLEFCGPPPTGVELVNFEAESVVTGVLLQWETTSEVDLAGFNLLRSSGVETPFKLLVSLPAQAPGSMTGYKYTWLDETAIPGVTHEYLLETIDTSGHKTLHGPIEVTAQFWILLPLAHK